MITTGQEEYVIAATNIEELSATWTRHAEVIRKKEKKERRKERKEERKKERHKERKKT